MKSTLASTLIATACLSASVWAQARKRPPNQSAADSASQAQQAAGEAAASAAKAEEARKSLEKAVKDAQGEAESAQKAATRALCAQRAAEKAANPDAEGPGAECAKFGNESPPKPKEQPDSGFDEVTFYGSANLISGSLSGDDGGAFATGGVGVAASSDGLAFSAAVAFGSSAIGTDNVTRDQYAQFLLAPSSAVGLQMQVRQLWNVSSRGLWLGWGLGLRLNGHRFTYSDTESQNIGMLSVDPAATASLTLSKKRRIEFFADLGLAFRFWRQPEGAFEQALGVDEDATAFYGVRTLAAFQIGNIYLGVEATKFSAFGDRSFSEFTDFAVLPYIGFRTGFGLEPVSDDETATECAKRAAKKRAQSSARSPSITPVF